MTLSIWSPPCSGVIEIEAEMAQQWKGRTLMQNGYCHTRSVCRFSGWCARVKAYWGLSASILGPKLPIVLRRLRTIWRAKGKENKTVITLAPALLAFYIQKLSFQCTGHASCGMQDAAQKLRSNFFIMACRARIKFHLSVDERLVRRFSCSLSSASFFSNIGSCGRQSAAETLNHI